LSERSSATGKLETVKRLEEFVMEAENLGVAKMRRRKMRSLTVAKALDTIVAKVERMMEASRRLGVFRKCPLTTM
jgi:hypothetical protein